MPRFDEYEFPFGEARDVVEGLIDKFPGIFVGFCVEDIGFILTKRKKTKSKHPIKVRKVSYPFYVFSDLTYVFEVFETKWEKLDSKRRNLAVFHAMCSIPVDGFDPESISYGKIIKPDFELYRAEFAAAGGVADWFEDDRARDPMDIADDDMQAVEDADQGEDPISSTSTKQPVTAQGIMGAGTEEQQAAS